MEAEQIERLKHRLRLREILLDKLILAILLVLVGAYANQRLAQYENALDTRLAQLRSAYDFQRMLDQRAIEAHERAWQAVIDFLEPVNSAVGQELTVDRIAGLEATGLQLEALYLVPEARAATDRFFNEAVPEFIRRWSDNPGLRLDGDTWEWLAGEAERVRAAIAGAIQARAEDAETA